MIRKIQSHFPVIITSLLLLILMVSSGSLLSAKSLTDASQTFFNSQIDLPGLTVAPRGMTFSAISAGTNHTCAIKTDGTVFCWGSNSDGQSNPPAGSFSSISAGRAHTCGIKTNGIVSCWGSNNYGQTNAPSGTFISIGAGDSHTCGVKTGGSVVCWGSNFSGQSTPPSGTFSSVSTGSSYTCGLKSNGSIACWGSNDFGESTPPSGVFVAVTTGHGSHTCGLKADGSIMCWGWNYWEQNNPPAGNFSSVTGGGSHTCGLKTNGIIACWGLDNWGQSSPPALQFSSVSAGGWHSCGLTTDGIAVCWGYNENGESNPPTDLPDVSNYALDGNTVLAGTTIYVRDGDNWNAQGALIPNRVVEPWEEYGIAIALQGNTAAVTSYGQDSHHPPEEPDGPGSLFIFKRSGTVWSQKQEIAYNGNFGESADIDANTIIVSDEGEYDDYINGVYFVEYNGTKWVTTAGFPTNDCCGPTDSSVAISGDLALALGVARANNESELVHVYHRAGGVWSEQNTLPYTYSYPHQDLDLDGNTAVIGSKVYVMNGANWTLQGNLIPNEPVSDLGQGVAVEGNTIVISGSDKSFVFTRTGNMWTQTQKLIDNGMDVASTSVDISGQTVLVGKHIFNLSGSPTVSELLVNGSFETAGADDTSAYGWEYVNATGDARRCTPNNKPSQAVDGRCFYNMVGTIGENSDLKQDVNLSNFALQSGDRISMNGYVYTKGDEVNTRARVLVKYTGQPSQKLGVNFFSPNNGWQPIPTQTLTLSGTPSVVRMILNNKSPSGRVRYDALSLTWQQSGGGLLPLNGALPLPAAP